MKTAFYEANRVEKNDTIISKESNEYESNIKGENQAEIISVTDDETSSLKKKTMGTARYLRRRGNKSIESRLSTTNYSNDDGFPPYNDPNK